MGEHALLSASSAHRWMHCPRSPHFEANFPDRGSVSAAEGTLAHAMGELKLRHKLLNQISLSECKRELDTLRENELYSREMDWYTDDYAEYAMTVAMEYPSRPYIAAEQRLDLSRWVPGGFGTGDCIIIGNGLLNIIDFKYGKGVRVDAEDNPQIRLYALGSLARYRMIFPVERVRMTIYQPRLEHISFEELSREELEHWGEQCAALAAKAYADEGEFSPGDWCRFCKGKGACKAYADQQLALEGLQMPVGAMTPAQIAQALEKGEKLGAWLSGVEEYALTFVLEGGSIPGWKAVEGRSIRRFADTDKAIDTLLAAGYEKAILYDPPKPKTLSQLENLVGKKDFATILGPQIVKPKGAPTLVPASDKREPYVSVDAKDVFKPIV